MSREIAAAGGRAGAREERQQGHRLRRARAWRSPRRPRSASPRTSTCASRSTANTGEYESFRRWQVVADDAVETPGAADPAVRGEEAARRRPARGLHRGAARGDRVRPHRRADREAGHPAEDPRRRARADPARLPGARREAGDRHRQAHGARQRDHRVGPPRGGAAARPDDPEGKPARRRPRARLAAADRPQRARPAAGPVAHRAGVHHRSCSSSRCPRSRKACSRSSRRRATRACARRSRCSPTTGASTRSAPASACAARACRR